METVGDLIDVILDLKSELRRMDRRHTESIIDLLRWCKCTNFDTDKMIQELEEKLNTMKGGIYGRNY